MKIQEWSIEIQNWKNLHHLKWSPHGVSLLTGGNGVGKTSILEALQFLKTRKFGSYKSSLKITLTLNSLKWSIAIDENGNTQESLKDDEELVFDVSNVEDSFLMLEILKDKRIKNLNTHLDKIRIYKTDPFMFLGKHTNRKKLISEIKKWSENQSAWFFSNLKKTFPHLPCDYNTVIDTKDSEFFKFSKGFLYGLFFLFSVGNAAKNSVIAFDSLDYAIQPQSLRCLLESIREIADEKNLTVILVTQSPVLMNEYKGYEDQFFILRHKQEGEILPLSRTENSEWLAHFSLGDVYSRHYK